MRHRLAKHSHVIDKHFSMLPSPELRRRNIDRYHKMFSLGNFFHANEWQNELAILSFQMYVDRPWPRADCLLRTQYNRYALHCAQENPRWIEFNCEFLWFLQVFYAGASHGNGEPYNITDGDFVGGNTHGMFLVSWGLKWYFGKIISPSISFQTPR